MAFEENAANAFETIGAKRVVIDTIESVFAGFLNEPALRSELVRLFRWLKEQGVTAVVTGERGMGMLTRYGLEEYISRLSKFHKRTNTPS